jgi:hypothetical protein
MKCDPATTYNAHDGQNPGILAPMRRLEIILLHILVESRAVSLLVYAEAATIQPLFAYCESLRHIYCDMPGTTPSKKYSVTEDRKSIIVSKATTEHNFYAWKEPTVSPYHS